VHGTINQSNQQEFLQHIVQNTLGKISKEQADITKKKTKIKVKKRNIKIKKL